MKKTKKFGFFLFLQLSLFLGFFFYSQLFLSSLDRQYKEQELDVIETLLLDLKQKDPALAQELLHTLLTKPITSPSGRTFLNEHGIVSASQLNNLDAFEQIKLETNHSFQMVYFYFFLFFLISSLSYFYLQRREMRKISSYLDKVLNGNYNIQVKEYDDGDMELLASNICKITTLLKEKNDHANQGKEQLESVLSDISHQLKTPLTSMYVINDLLKNEQLEVEKKRELLGKNHAQLERIEWLVTTLLKMSRLDSGMVEMKKEPVKIQTLVEEALEPLRIPMELKQQKVELQGDGNVEGNLDFHWTLEAFVNILKNAHEHTDEKGTITIHWMENPLYTEIDISDTGIGIKKEELPYIFERFYKGSGNKESIGIGLNMSKTIIQKQNGVISVVSEEGKGTTFSIKFYKNIV